MIQTDNQNQTKVMPRTELDFNLMTTDSVWGNQDINPELRARLSRFYAFQDPKTGQKSVTKESLWSLLGFYTRDMRLANLSTWNNEFEYCQYHLDLANDLLQADQIEPFLIALSRVATVLELSQSKGGFLRKRMNTLTQEHYQGDLEPKKKSFFGFNKEKGQQ